MGFILSFISAPSLVVILTAGLVGAMLLFYRPLVSSSAWRATITPLASIMGSGFLVCVPLLYTNIGNFAVWAMAGLLCLAYGVGSVIRFNIRYGEPLLEKQKSPENSERAEHRLHVAHRQAGNRVKARAAAEILEKVSHVALAGAYCVSVSYYLQLLAGFTLPSSVHDQAWIGKGLVTLILAGIAIVGALRGLKGIERVERMVVGINLAMIAALIAGLVYHNILTLSQGTWQLNPFPVPADKFHIARMLMGMLIVVQGFETSRFLGSEHSAGERIRTMRWAQLISTGIYLVFIGLMAVVINKGGLGGQAEITAIVGFSKIVAPILPIMITLTAIGSQFSAATADDAGCSGLLESILKGRVNVKFDYIIVSGAAIALTWITDVYQIISFASRAFAFYYALQCLVAILVLKSSPAVSSPGLKNILFVFLALVCAAVAWLGIPAG